MILCVSLKILYGNVAADVQTLRKCTTLSSNVASVTAACLQRLHADLL